MSDDREIKDLLPGYVLGALEGDELRRVEERLAAGSDELDRELHEWTRQLERLADEVPPEQPSEMTRARLLREIEEPAEALPGGALGWFPWAAAAALFLAAVALGWQNFTLRSVVADLARDEEAVAAQIVELRSELDEARAVSSRLARAQRIVAAPEARRVLLAGLEPAPGATANCYIDPGAGRAVFYASDLPPLDADSTYQLWFIGADGPVSGGVFAIDADGEASLLVEGVAPPAEIAAWAVTIEPAGGVPQPTGAMVLKG